MSQYYRDFGGIEMKKIIAIILLFATITSTFTGVVFASEDDIYQDSETNSEAESEDMLVSMEDLSAKSAILMDALTGTVLYSKDADLKLPPASVTKIMTLLLVAEAIARGDVSLEENVSVSEYAAGMGGSQIFIKEGEEFTVEELLKSTVIASANDAAVALAELVSGSESLFVDEMNKRAKELGMKDTTFENVTGLDDTTENHLTSAYDIALMSSELIKHDIILKYSNLWQSSIRDGEFILTNTNRLVRYYSGCTGLKTGSTDKAGFCISATAQRNGLSLIAVIMGAPTRDARNNDARMLLDYGFANYALYSEPETDIEDVPVKRGESEDVKVYSKPFKILVKKSDLPKIEKTYSIPESISAPFENDSKIGEITYTIGGAEIGKCDICTRGGVDSLDYVDILWRIMQAMLVGKSI